MKIGNLYKCAHDICQLRFFYQTILEKSLTFKSWLTGYTELSSFAYDQKVALFNKYNI